MGQQTVKKLLRVNLTTGRMATEEFAEKDVEMFIGGRGLGAALLYKEIKPGIDPLGPENKLIFMTGPLTGTKAPGSSKYVVLTKSPLTNIYLMSVSSRDFGSQIKKCGYDALIVEGTAAKPVYLYINNGRAEILDAGKMWGMPTNNTDAFIKEQLQDSKLKIACIGPAGENQVPYASIINEWRAVGRGGAGAVMGSKNLKAIAVKGSANIPIFHVKEFNEAVKRAYSVLAANPKTASLKAFGTTTSVMENNEFGILPVNNWQEAYWPGAAQISGDVMKGKYLIKSTKCTPCVAHCGKLTIARQGEYAGTITEGPEYETLYSFGACCGITDFDAIIEADALCDKFGLDTISMGVTLAFAMECYERGYLTEKDTEGIQLSFGNHSNLKKIIHQTAYRKGIGELLALGTKRLSEQIGHNSEDFAMHAKGMELGGYDPRAIKGMATVYSCGPRGGCHHAGGRTLPTELDNTRFDRLSEKGKGPLTKHSRDYRAAMDSSIMCTMSSPGVDSVAEMLSAATGLNYDSAGLEIVGDRISNMERAFNVREGITRNNDTLPARLLRETVTGGPSSPVNLDLLLDEYYAACGWDLQTGVPTREKLTQLGISYLWEDLRRQLTERG